MGKLIAPGRTNERLDWSDPKIKNKATLFHKGADLNRPLLDQAPQIFKEQHLGLYIFLDAILDGKPASADFSVGLKVQEVVDAALESDRQGCWISLPRGGAT